MPHFTTCKFCEVRFEAPNAWKRYCSHQCWNKAERAASKAAVASYSPTRKRAMALLRNALNNGTLVRQPCELCGDQPSDAHHDDYSQPLNIRWLCRSHHKQHHIAFGKAANA